MTLDDVRQIVASDPLMGVVAIVFGVIVAGIYKILASRRNVGVTEGDLGVMLLGGATFIIPTQIMLLCLTGAETIKLTLLARISLFLGAGLAAKWTGERLMERYNTLSQPHKDQDPS